MMAKIATPDIARLDFRVTHNMLLRGQKVHRLTGELVLGKLLIGIENPLPSIDGHQAALFEYGVIAEASVPVLPKEEPLRLADAAFTLRPGVWTIERGTGKMIPGMNPVSRFDYRSSMLQSYLDEGGIVYCHFPSTYLGVEAVEQLASWSAGLDDYGAPLEYIEADRFLVAGLYKAAASYLEANSQTQ